MKKEPRLIKTLKLLNKAEIRQFRDYVKSPFFNKNPKLIKLTAYLIKLYPEFPAKKLDKKTIFKVLYGNEEPYNEQQVHDHFSLLVRLAEDFFTQIGFERDETGRNIYLLEELRRRNAKKDFRKLYQRTIDKVEEKEIRDSGFYLQMHRIQQMGEAFSGQIKNRDGGPLLQAQVNNLDMFYLSSKLKASCEMLNRKNIINAAYHSEMEAELLEYLAGENYYSCIPSISIYHKIYLTLAEPEKEEHFYDLVKLLSENVNRFHRSEAYNMYAYAQNYCIKQINRGKKEFLQELFHIYQQLLAAEILLDSGVLAHEHYKNIITVGLRLKEYSWTQDFLENYREFLAPEYRENAYNYNLSAIYYERGQYTEAMRFLNRVQFSDVYYHLSAKSILL
ncbi:MAG: hypothetical protein KDE26_26045, partial [Bacteroidetes bacterium]|nr:hypothetical protein [Bacteroidota bacterium]